MTFVLPADAVGAARHGGVRREGVDVALVGHDPERVLAVPVLVRAGSLRTAPPGWWRVIAGSNPCPAPHRDPASAADDAGVPVGRCEAGGLGPWGAGDRTARRAGRRID